MNPSEPGVAPEFLQIASGNKSIPSNKDFIYWFKKIAQIIDITQENITVRLVDEAESRALNKQFKGKDGPTNVLSFPAQLPADIDAEYLGDIIICAPLVEREADAQNKAPGAHWAHMLVHGILHLKGYDHIQDEQAKEMESLERNIISDMGFPDPYSE